MPIFLGCDVRHVMTLCTFDFDSHLQMLLDPSLLESPILFR